MRDFVITMALGMLSLSLGGCLQEYQGNARVIDGDTLAIGSVHFRLQGIDAPELAQICPDGWEAGKAARAQLAWLINDDPVRCTSREVDKYGRTLAHCYSAEGVDLQAAMVRDGYAIAYSHYSVEYLDEERLARARNAGVHEHQCEPPSLYRHHQARAK